jgi:hypothetical protein
MNMAGNTKRFFMRFIWSTTCSSCLKDTALVSAFHKEMPELKMIMPTSDDLSENAQRLRFEIAPKGTTVVG